MLSRVHREERGVAMIVAMLVSFIVLLLSIYVINLSLHSSTSSAYDRKRVLSVAAAEAGVNDFWSVLRSNGPATLPCVIDGPENTGTLDTSPGTATYSVNVVYFDTLGRKMCTSAGDPALTADNPPVAAKITSVGMTSGTVPRTMESEVRLAPIVGSGFDAVIISENGMVIRNQVDVDTPTDKDADIYVNNGDLCISQQETFDGSIYVSAGNAYLANSVTVNGQVWANGEVGMPQGTVNGDVKSSGGAITTRKSDCKSPPKYTTPSTGGTINGGDAWAYTSAAVPPITLTSGTVHLNQVLGPPPTHPLPRFCWDPAAIGAVDPDPNTGDPPCESTGAEWTADPQPLTDPISYPYVVHTFSGSSACSDAKAWLTGGVIGDGNPQAGFASIPDPGPTSSSHGNTVVRVQNSGPTGCMLAFDDPGVETVQFEGNLAIYADHAIWLQNQTNWQAVNGKHSLYFMIGYQQEMVDGGILLSPYDILQRGICGALPNSEGQGPGPFDIEVGNQTNFGPTPSSPDSDPVQVTLYSPCRLLMYNQNDFEGQMLGGTVLPRNNFTVTYVPLVIPGASEIVGWRVQVVYLREVANSS